MLVSNHQSAGADGVGASRSDPLIELVQVTKRYPNGVLANEEVSLGAQAAEIHAIVGENGAGKSTSVKILYGLEQPDAGHVRMAGRICRFRRPKDAIAHGIGLVPQHLQLVTSLTVAENVVLGDETTRGPFFSRGRACELTEALAQRHGLQVDPTAVVSDLSAGAQQRVEILKALRRGARVLLLDEPTALLTPHESEAFFGSLRGLVQAGLTVVLITHRLPEVLQVADRFTVMRAGRVVESGCRADLTEARLAESIVGRALPVLRVARVDAQGQRPRVAVRDVSLVRARGRPELLRLSLDVAAGEILGIAGVEGNGQNRLGEILSGVRTPTAGSVLIDGVPAAGLGVRRTRALGVGCVPEDRLQSGVAPRLSIVDNLISLDYFKPTSSRWGFLDVQAMRQRAREIIAGFAVRARDEEVPVGTLSGGNMQKVVMARELLAQPRFLVACQPTRGVDIAAAAALRRSLVSLRDGGAAVLLISADLDELFALSDRIAVLYEGRLVAHFAADSVSQAGVGLYMTGLRRDAAATATLSAPFTDAGAAGTSP